METTAMRLAIPTRNRRISPVFDSAGQVLLVDFEEGKECSRCVAPLPADSLAGRVTRLKELAVVVLICGGISRTLRQMIEADGIQVYSWTAGPVDEVLDAYREGRLHDARWLMPGCSDPERSEMGGDQGRGTPAARPGRRSGSPKGEPDTRR
jgi:predicted Fe-Mo cluster-binding NifX family protein